MMKYNLWDCFRDTVEQFSDSEAIVQGDQILTFTQWCDRATDYGSWFNSVGRPRDRIIVWMNNSMEMASAMFGIWAGGGIVVLMNPDSPPSHWDHAMRTTEPIAVLCDAEFKLAKTRERIRIEKATEVPSTGDSCLTEMRILPTDPASVVFTSGSTGKPKGVTQTHGSLIGGCRAVGGYLGLTSEDRILCPIPWSFDYGYGQLLSTGLIGATQLLPTASDPFAVCGAIGRGRPTVLAGLPSLFTYLLRGVSPFRETDVSSLRIVTNTGGTIPAPVLKDMFEVFSHCEIFLNYGLTESYRTSYLDPVLVRDLYPSIGKPIPGVDIAIVKDDGTVAEPGEIGEIVHRGDYLFMGYWNDPKATAEALRPDPLAPPNCPNPQSVLFTGDYGFLDRDGLLYYRGRRDHQLKSMGVRVNPDEIEELLYQSGFLKEVAVFGVPHDMIGDEIWAAVVPTQGVEEVKAKLASYAREAMSQYMAPRRYLVKNNELPKTNSGKIDYPGLKQEATGCLSASMTE